MKYGMWKSLQNIIQNKPLRIATFLTFLGGIALLVVPDARQQVTTTLPITGQESGLSVSIAADKDHVQLYGAEEDANRVNYTVTVENKSACVETPLDVTLLVDASGSMKDSFVHVKKSVRSITDQIGTTENQIGLVVFADDKAITLPLGSDPDEINTMLEGIDPGGQSNLNEGFEAAQQQLQAVDSSKKVMIVFSDGRVDLPNVDNLKDLTKQVAANIREQGVFIQVLSFGVQADTDLLQSIASADEEAFLFEPTDVDIIGMLSHIKSSFDSYSYGTQVFAKVDSSIGIPENISNEGVYQGERVVWDVGTLECQESRQFSFSWSFFKSAHDLDTSEVLAYAKNDLGEVTSEVSHQATIHAPVFRVYHSDEVDNAMPGETLNYQLSVENIGSGNALPVSFQIPIHRLITLDERTISGGGVVVADMIRWERPDGYTLSGSLAPIPGSSNSFIAYYSGDVLSDLTYGLYDVQQEANILISGDPVHIEGDRTEIAYGPDLSIDVTANPEQYSYPTGTIALSIRIRNVGSVDAVDPVLGLQFDPEYLETISALGGTVLYDTVIYPIELVRVDDFVELTYNGRIRESYYSEAGEVSFVADIQESAGDLSEDDNAQVYTLEVTNDANLSVWQYTQGISYTTDDQIPHTVEISNVGRYRVDAALLDLQWDDELSYIPNSGALEGGEVQQIERDGSRWSIPAIDPGQTFIFTYSLKSNSDVTEGNYSNSATVIWEKDVSGLNGERESTVLVSIVDPVDLQEEFALIEPAPATGVPLTFGQLPESGETATIVKVIVALILILPFPMMFAWDVIRTIQEQKSKEK